MRKNLFTVFLCLFLSPLFYCQTQLSGILASSQTLALSSSPYLITANLTVPSGNVLTVDPGVEIMVAENVHLVVKGSVNFMGTVAQPIYMHAKDSIWGNIFLDSTLSQKSTFNYMTIENARESVKITEEPGAIYGYFSTFEVNNCHFRNNLRCMSAYQCPNMVFKNCLLDSTNRGEKIHGQYCNNAIVSDNLLYATRGDNDAIDFDASNNVLISGNRILGGGDDGIDIGQCDSIGCNGVTVQKNYILNMFNKGVSNGEYCLNIKLDHNVIAGCTWGIGAKSGAYVTADHNSIFHCRLGITSYHHTNQIWGPGHLTFSNGIVDNCDTTFRVDPTAFLTVSYTLADDTIIPGTGNIKGNASFISPLLTPSGNFYLNANSDAIDNGDPGFALDPDATRSDMGAHYFGDPSGIQMIPVAASINIFPNPSNGIFKIESPGIITNIEVTDAVGKLIQRSQPGSSTHDVDISGLGKGIYFIRITKENETITIDKIVIAN
jgi:hypothetical protein